MNSQLAHCQVCKLCHNLPDADAAGLNNDSVENFARTKVWILVGGALIYMVIVSAPPTSCNFGDVVFDEFPHLNLPDRCVVCHTSNYKLIK